ncbi:hypothetical protein EIP86_007835 [Pleurotus ostreatoroseus]|nr:hypothetical protein EIP86_007835 [Pleurotus ostreatoroseus]
MDVMTCWVLDAAPEVHRAGLSIQDMTWGVGATNKTIIVTSALDDWEASSTPPDFFGGYHRMFDLRTQQMIMQLSNRETGECAAIDPRGNTLALAVAPATHVTRLKNIPDPQTRRLVEVEVYSWTWKFALELYDVRAHRTRPAQRTLMPAPDEAASTVVKPSISSVAWSPDGIYVAASRTDNCTQVFDVRMLARGALYEFWHGSPMEGSKSDEMFGVCRAEWVQDARCGLGLVTGGADGCVRLWDVHRSRGESTVLAQSTHYSSWFCMGDTSKGEHAVVL